jgi:hypothetical protein
MSLCSRDLNSPPHYVPYLSTRHRRTSSMRMLPSRGDADPPESSPRVLSHR